MEDSSALEDDSALDEDSALEEDSALLLSVFPEESSGLDDSSGFEASWFSPVTEPDWLPFLPRRGSVSRGSRELSELSLEFVWAVNLSELYPSELISLGFLEELSPPMPDGIQLVQELSNRVTASIMDIITCFIKTSCMYLSLSASTGTWIL